MDRYEAVVRYIGTGDYVPRIEKYADGDLVLYAEAASRIAALEAQLLEAETTIGALKYFIGEQADQIGTLEQEIAELRADLEWATGPRITTTGQSYGTRWFWRWSPERRFEYDGTPDDLRRAIRAARKG